MSTAEAGRRGGQARKRTLGPGGYARLGQLGGARVRALVAAGRRAEASRGDMSQDVAQGTFDASH